MSAHTPGPWAQHPTYPLIVKQDCAPIAGPDEGVMICNAQSHNNSGFFPSFDEGRANARLIAAAPDLLAAVLAYVEHFESHRITNTHGARDFDFTGQIASMARAAIAKATGAAL